MHSSYSNSFPYSGVRSFNKVRDGIGHLVRGFNGDREISYEVAPNTTLYFRGASSEFQERATIVYVTKWGGLGKTVDARFVYGHNKNSFADLADREGNRANALDLKDLGLPTVKQQVELVVPAFDYVITNNLVDEPFLRGLRIARPPDGVGLGDF